MISPVTQKTVSPASETQFSPAHAQESYSTISSLNPLHILSAFFRFMLWLFSCCPNKPLPQDDSPEVDPRELPRSDPFVQTIFAFDASGCYSYRSEAREKILYLFAQLGTGSFWSWIPKALTLTRVEEEVVAIKPHPLTFLYYVTSNRLHTSHFVHFRKEGERGKWLLQLKTGRNPWEELLCKQEANFAQRTDLEEMIPGFCNALKLDQQKVLTLARGKKWRALIQHVYETRKKHFNL